MQLKSVSYDLYQIPLSNGQIRQGAFVKLESQEGRLAVGDVAPLPKWSPETLKEAALQLDEKISAIQSRSWTLDNWLGNIHKLDLLPSVQFGVESALLELLSPLPPYKVAVSALLMGSPREIMQQAEQRLKEGYRSAKLKVGNLSFSEALAVIQALKDKFFLRVDVNRAWSLQESLRFFEQFPLDAFEYVEEPFQNPKELASFTHPLAVDESFPDVLSLGELDRLPNLKALIYKPTIQGGMAGCLPLHDWAKRKGVDLVLSSSFESDLGLGAIASMACRLGLKSPIGIGTYHYLTAFSGHSKVRCIDACVCNG